MGKDLLIQKNFLGVMDVLLPLGLAIAVSMTYYYSNQYSIKKEKGKRILSFSAGVAIVYILLELFPVFTEGALGISKLVFLSIPGGFIIHHIIEKEIYTHNRRHELIRMLSLEENVFSFVYHMIIGMVIVFFIRGGLIEGFLFFVPVGLYTFLSMLPASPHRSRWKAIVLSSSTLIGTVLAILFWDWIPVWFEFVLVGLAIGVLLFTVIRHHIPFGRKGRLGYFTAGFVIYSALIVLSWYI